MWSWKTWGQATLAWCAFLTFAPEETSVLTIIVAGLGYVAWAVSKETE